MANTKAFRLTRGLTSKMVCEALEDFLRDSEGMMTRSGTFSAETIIKMPEETTAVTHKVAEGYFVQGKKRAHIWSRLSGIEQAVTVYIFRVGEIVNITVGFSKWSDRISDFSLGTFLEVPKGIIVKTELFLQKKIPLRILDFTEKFIISGGR